MMKRINFRLYPTLEQVELLDRQFGCCRFIYNWFLDYSTWLYREHAQNTNYYDWARVLTKLKEYYTWLRVDVSIEVLQQTLMRLSQAYIGYFHNRTQCPKKKLKQGEQSFTVVSRFKIYINVISIPKIKNIPCVVTEDLSNYDLRNVTVSKTSTGKYFASVCYDDGQEVQKASVPDKDTAVGIDLGLKHFAILSTGEKVEHPKHFQKAEKRLVQLQRRMEKKQKGSKNREKARKKLALQHEKIANQRKDFLHKLSTQIVTESQGTVCVESLNVAGMMQNRFLSKSIGASGWGMFLTMLKYKCLWQGKNLLECGMFDPTSKMCSTEGCDYKHQSIKLSEREWVCPKCTVIHDRDVNAAKNIITFSFAKNDIPGGTGDLKSVEGKAIVSSKDARKASPKKQKVKTVRSGDYRKAV